MTQDATPDGRDAEPGLAGHAADLTGAVIGGCTVTRRIGVGGMGVVYEASQDPPARKVALKLLRTALATEEGAARFEREARTLGSLRHPGIAQIYEAGSYVTASGETLPYFVMEFVPDASPLVAFADRSRLGLRQRLALFVRVCEAVHFGHTKGVIHRDLKPDNILVDADGNPKVIDFGIARTTQDDADPTAAKTHTGQLVGTLPYMSPEQVLGRREDVDTRSDVYALGVILYQLVTGRLPYDLEGLNLVESAGAIAYKAPIPPSRFAPETPGDVTIIVQKALAKDPAQRYASAASLGKDIGRFLSYVPIDARPPAFLYQARLFAKRNRIGFVAIVGAAAILVVATVVSALFAASEARQRTRAQSLLHRAAAFVPDVLSDIDPELARLPASTGVRARLAAKVAEHLDGFRPGDSTDPVLLKSIAKSYLTLGAIQANVGGRGLGTRTEALESFGRARQIYEQLHAKDPNDSFARERLVAVDLIVTATYIEQGLLAKARTALERAGQALEGLPAGEASWGARHRDQVEGLGASLAWYEGRYADALAGYERIVAKLEAKHPDPTEPAALGERIAAELDVVETLGRAGRAQEVPTWVARIESRAARLLEAQPGHESWWLAARTYRMLGDLVDGERAVALYEKAVSWAGQLSQRDPGDAVALAQLAEARASLGAALQGVGRTAQAIPLLEQGLRDLEVLRLRDPANRMTGWNLMVARTRLGAAMRLAERLDEAGEHLDAAQRMAEAFRSARPEGAESDIHLSEVHWEQGLVAAARWQKAASHGDRVAALRQARDHFARAQELLAELDRAGRLPDDRRKNLATFGHLVESSTHDLRLLEEDAPR